MPAGPIPALLFAAGKPVGRPLDHILVKPVRQLRLLEADDDLIRGELMKRIRDRLNRIGVAKRPMRTQTVLPQAADALLETLLGVRAIFGIVRCPAVQWGAENGRDDEHVRSTPGMLPHLRAKRWISTGLVCDEENSLMLREWWISHHSSIRCGHSDDRSDRPGVHRPEH